MPTATPPLEGDFAVYATSWQLSLGADGYADSTLRSYTAALADFAAFARGVDPELGPLTVTREHVRGWLVRTRDTLTAGTARSRFAGLRHFFAWLVAEQERDDNPTAGIRTPNAGQPRTPVVTVDDLRALLDTCAGLGFLARRDRAIILLFVDGGPRLAELTGLAVTDVDLAGRMVLVKGKGSGRSGPRPRAIPLGVKAAQALDRYLRERRRHPYAATAALWLGDRGRPSLTADGVTRMLGRRGATVGLSLHPHMLRHTFAHNFRAAGGSEGDLMVLGGWRSRAMLDRYGATGAAERAREAARQFSLGDRL